MAGTIISRRSFLQGAAAGACAAYMTPRTLGATNRDKPNVLFICVDDLRPQLGCYGNEYMITPNLDALAGSGVVFDRHFVSVPTCGASRRSMLTGAHPRTPKALTNEAFGELPREDSGVPNSLPDLFRRNGYTTVGIGKISHSPNGRRMPQPSGRFDEAGKMIYSEGDGEPELPLAWNRIGAPTGDWGDSWSAFFAYDGAKTRSYTDEKSPAWEDADVPDTGYPDGLIADAAIQELNALQGSPFFLAVGFYKPHLPFCAPKKYWDLYDRNAIPLPEHREPPKNVDPALSLNRNGELVNRYASLANPAEATDDETQLLRHGYFACVSYVDAQIGRLLTELDRLGLRDNTLVVVWGDHGWHLGDLYVWGKHTTFDFSLRSALIMSVPGQMHTGAHVPDVVESVDIYPTLADVCGLSPPDGLDGISLRPALEGKPLDKTGAFGYWRRGEHKATTLRTPQYRITEWKDKKGEIAQVELYDHITDPFETTNIAGERPETVAALRERLYAHS